MNDVINDESSVNGIINITKEVGGTTRIFVFRGIISFSKLLPFPEDPFIALDNQSRSELISRRCMSPSSGVTLQLQTPVNSPLCSYTPSRVRLTRPK